MNYLALINALIEEAKQIRGREALDKAIIERAALLIEEFKRENPMFVFFVDMLIKGTPHQALQSLAAINQEAARLPLMTLFLQMLQKKLREQ
jgi:hypothetical protein